MLNTGVGEMGKNYDDDNDSNTNKTPTRARLDIDGVYVSGSSWYT